MNENEEFGAVVYTRLVEKNAPITKDLRKPLLLILVLFLPGILFIAVPAGAIAYYGTLLLGAFAYFFVWRSRVYVGGCPACMCVIERRVSIHDPAEVIVICDECGESLRLLKKDKVLVCEEYRFLFNEKTEGISVAVKEYE